MNRLKRYENFEELKVDSTQVPAYNRARQELEMKNAFREISKQKIPLKKLKENIGKPNGA